MKFDYMSISLANERETQGLGFQMAGLIEPPLCVYLEGEIGAGKTSLVRSILREMPLLTAISLLAAVPSSPLPQCPSLRFVVCSFGGSG